jgi:hypothetical protein
MRLPRRRVLTVLALQACALGLVATSAGTGGAATSPTVRLLAHDVSHPVWGRPHSHPHATPRHHSLVVRFASPLQRLLPRAHRTLAFSTHSLAPVTVASWDGTAGPGSYWPADPNGDIGMTQYVQSINFRLAVYSRAGSHANLGLITSSEFWNGLGGPDAAGLCATSPGGDPSIQYDRLADRWVYSEFAFDVDVNNNPVAPIVQCVAVSKTADATGEWYRYAFQVSNTKFMDYPKLGIWPDGYYLSYNQFDLSNNSYAGAGALALERSAMLTGSAAQARYFDLESVNPGLGGMLPASLTTTTTPDAGSPELYLQSLDDPTNANDRLQVWGFHVDWTNLGASTFQPIQDLPVVPASVPVFDSTFNCGAVTPYCITQDSESQGLDPVSSVATVGGTNIPQLMYHLSYLRDAGGTQHLVATQTVDLGGNHAAVRWYDLANAAGSWAINSGGDYAPDGDNRFMPSGAIDTSDELAIAYSVSSVTTFPSLRYTGRVPGDGVNTMSIAESSILAGAASQSTVGRWGDYSSLSLDPLGLCNFWFTGEYAGGGSSWRTRIGEFNFSTCVPAAPTRPVLTGDPGWSTPIVREAQTITRVAPTFSTLPAVTYQWRRCDQYGFSCVDLPGETGPTHVFTAADAAGNKTLRLQATATNATGTVVASSIATPIVQSLPPANTTLPAISGTAQAGQTLATTNGSWTSSSPLSYTYRWRRCSASCVFIPGANSATYTLTASDVGDTVDVIVSATNTGGGTDATAAATATVSAAPVATTTSATTTTTATTTTATTTTTTTTTTTSSGGGGGGGGAGAGAPDLAVSGFASTAVPAVGDSVIFVITVTDKNAKAAQGLFVDVTLPSGLQYVTSTTDRGSGCVVKTSSTLRCSLDWLSADALSGHIQLTAKVTAAGTQTLSATATDQQGDIDNSNNTLSLAFGGTAATTTTTTTTSGSTGVTNTTSGVPTGLNGDTTPTKKQDKKKPTAHALSSAAKRGRLASLRFTIYDDKGVAKALTSVKRNGRVVGTANTGYGPVAFGSVYYISWHVPAKAAKGKYSFCVVAVDRAGNKSAQSCAPVALK